MAKSESAAERLRKAEILARKINLLLDVVVAEGGEPYEFSEVQAGVKQFGYDLSRTRWYRLRSGESPERVPEAALEAIARFFSVDPRYLMEETGELPERVQKELELLRSMRRAQVKSFAARTLGPVDPATLEALTKLIDDMDGSADR